LITTDAVTLENENPPVANDDTQLAPNSTSVSIQLDLFANDSEPDGENFFIQSITQPPVGFVVIDDAENGLVTFTYGAGIPFPGTSFDYTISDSNTSLCPGLGLTDTVIATLKLSTIITNRKITYRINPN